MFFLPLLTLWWSLLTPTWDHRPFSGLKELMNKILRIREHERANKQLSFCLFQIKIKISLYCNYHPQSTEGNKAKIPVYLYLDHHKKHTHRLLEKKNVYFSMILLFPDTSLYSFQHCLGSFHLPQKGLFLLFLSLQSWLNLKQPVLVSKRKW